MKIKQHILFLMAAIISLLLTGVLLQAGFGWIGFSTFLLTLLFLGLFAASLDDTLTKLW